MLNTERLQEVMALDLKSGGHRDISHGLCVMEAVSWVADEPWSDHPACASPVISTFMRAWNDALPDAERTDLLRDLIPQIVGTRSTPEIEQRRATMAADWLIREHTPAWLRLAGLNQQADALAGLPEITDFSQCPGLMPTIKAVRSDAAAAWAAARDAAGAAAWAAAWAAARDAAWDAVGAAAGDAARDAAGAAARDAAWDAVGAAVGAAAGAAARDAAWDAVGDAAGAAARDAAWDAVGAAVGAAAGDAAWAAAWAAARDAVGASLQSTRRELQQSAKALVIRTCALKETP